MFKLIKVLILLFFFFPPAVFPYGAQFTNIIVFGDSLSDVGNNQWIYNEDMDNLKSAPLVNEDEQQAHPLWVNEVAKILFPGKKVYPSSSVSLNHLNPNQDNISYAWGAAESGERYINSGVFGAPYFNECTRSGLINQNPALNCVPGVITQIKFYLNDLHQAHANPSPNTLFVIWIGANDITHNIRRLFPLKINKHEKWNSFTNTSAAFLESPFFDSWDQEMVDILDSNQEDYMKNLVSYPIAHLLEAIALLKSHGVSSKQIFIFDLPDISKTPHINAVHKVLWPIIDFKKYNKTFTDVYNRALYEKIGSQVIPASHIFSTHALLDRMVNHEFPELQNVDDECLTANKLPLCSGFLFYDDIHPTVIVGKIIATEFINTLKNNPT